MLYRSLILCALLILPTLARGQEGQPSAEHLAKWLKRFPQADTNKDGKLTAEEAEAFRKKQMGRRGPPRTFKVHPGWNEERFPDHAICYRTPKEIAAAYAKVIGEGKNPVTSFPVPKDGGLRVVATGHSFMAPGYSSLPLICKAAGFEQPMLKHVGGGITGSTRFKWEQENGIFQHEGKAKPRLLASIANAEWDVMMWGPYFLDQPKYYEGWIDFCLKYQPKMKFYLSDSWSQVEQLGVIPKSEKALTSEVMTRIGDEKREFFAKIIRQLNDKYPGKVFVLPTCDAMTLAVQHYHRGELPGVEGINRAIGGKKNSIWSDKLGHLGPGFSRLEGYVFYSTLYKKSPELLKEEVDFIGRGNVPGKELDRVFRKIAWQAVINNKLSGVTDKDGDGIGE